MINTKWLDCPNIALVGDGYCDDVSNNMECNFDGGDCCGADVNLQHCKQCQCLQEGKWHFDII